MATTPGFVEACQRADHNVAARGEGDCAVELDGRLVVFSADPSCTESRGKRAVGLAPRRNIDLAIPRLQDGNRQTRGRSEAEQAHAISVLDPGDP
jgi:hypothetical protein